jgi:molybdenum cofactor synthesis domain-containing protein
LNVPVKRIKIRKAFPERNIVPKTAAIVIIGNEILSGKVRDENTHFLASELRGLGVALRSVMVVPDELDAIAEAVAGCSGKYDFVFTSGGIGPTHDDITMRGVARAFGLRTVLNERLRELLVKRCGSVPSDVVLRMAELPEGAELVEANGTNFPPVAIRNVFIFPGIPEFLRKKFLAIRERFRGTPYHARQIFVNEEECFIAGAMDSVAAEFPDVEIGSYPKVNEKDYRVLVTLESRDGDALKKAFEKLLGLLPGDIVVRRA